ncbi:hypothetical protein [Streptomyces neyagawaensis]|uniref:hypothetical protein n=1 Tax=Streptomyces neyagawaensis TaxID=42238 RepID=UPI0006E26BF2|nr:hypothetical protein [Streptomyces neyagawaensis]MCL6736457.1 hypothetical protein [Streptomyces neyagawaensis]MDE1680852.1 hypothetical protein [Streptomyces neyagawaensis]
MSEPDELRDHDLSLLPEDTAQDLDLAEGILGLLTGWSAERLRLAREAAEPDPEQVARWTADSERYAVLLRRVGRMSPPELRGVVEELGPVARRAVEEGR